MIGSWRDIPLFGLAVVTTGTCSAFTQLKCVLYFMFKNLF